jgi:hypothetical protein
MMDWTLWLLVGLALASAASCAQAVRERVRPRRTGAIVALAAAALLVGFAVINYLQGATRIVEILELVEDGDVRSRLQVQARSEYAQRVAFSVILAMPALVLGIGFLGPRREAPEG